MSITYEIIAEWEDSGGRGGDPSKHALVKVTETQVLPPGEPEEDPEVTRHVYVEEFDFADRPNWRRMVDKEVSSGLLKRAIEHVSKGSPT